MLAAVFVVTIAVTSEIGQGCSRFRGRIAMGPQPAVSLHCPKLVLFGHNLLR